MNNEEKELERERRRVLNRKKTVRRQKQKRFKKAERLASFVIDMFHNGQKNKGKGWIPAVNARDPSQTYASVVSNVCQKDGEISAIPSGGEISAIPSQGVIETNKAQIKEAPAGRQNVPENKGVNLNQAFPSEKNGIAQR